MSLHVAVAIDAKSSIEQTGSYLVKDADKGTNDAEETRDAVETTDAEETTDAGKVAGKGRLFAEFYEAGYYTKTPQGLEFVYQNTKGDTVRLKATLTTTV